MKDYGKLISSKFYEEDDAYVNQMISLTKLIIRLPFHAQILIEVCYDKIFYTYYALL